MIGVYGLIFKRFLCNVLLTVLDTDIIFFRVRQFVNFTRKEIL